MKTRVEIKENSKHIIEEKYSTALLPCLLCGLLMSAATAVLAGFGGILLLPLSVGMNLVYLMLWRHESPSIELMFSSAFQENYGRKLCGKLLVGVYTWLWSLLLIIPGIVKSYSYAATSYILGRYTNVTAENAIKISMRIMTGHKMDLFIMDLSFLGWRLLGSLTFGILNIFWVNPYQLIATAGYFDEFLAEAIESGRIDASELI